MLQRSQAICLGVRRRCSSCCKGAQVNYMYDKKPDKVPQEKGTETTPKLTGSCQHSLQLTQTDMPDTWRYFFDIRMQLSDLISILRVFHTYRMAIKHLHRRDKPLPFQFDLSVC